MLLFSIIMFSVALVCLLCGMLIHSGSTDLIHEYHRKNVKDFEGYAHAMGGCLLSLSAIHLTSGLITLIWKSKAALIAAIIFYVIAFIIFLICIIRVQKKYNGSFFS